MFYMKKLFFITLTYLLPWIVKAQESEDVPAKPNPIHFVNDYVNILSSDQTIDLEHTLKKFNDSTSNQIVVVIIATTGGYDISRYAFTLGRKWGVGTKEFNNGVVLLIAKDDRKVFIATGYGLEGALPDATCKEIVDNDITPYFKDQDFYRGISNGVNDIIAATKGEYTPHKKSNSTLAIILFSVFAVFILGFVINGLRIFILGIREMGLWGFFTSWGGNSSTHSSGDDSNSGSSFGGGSFGGGGAGGSW